MRALGLDIGTVRIGVAVSDPRGQFAQPHSVLARQSVSADAAAVAALVASLGVEAVVVGVPVDLRGQSTPMTRKARQLIAALGPLVTVPIHESDERFSTAQAQAVLLSGGLTRHKRKEVIDQQAAVIILQSWLDARPTKFGDQG